MLTGLGVLFIALGSMMRHWAMTRGSIGLGSDDDERLRFGAALKWVGPIVALAGALIATVGLAL